MSLQNKTKHKRTVTCINISDITKDNNKVTKQSKKDKIISKGSISSYKTKNCKPMQKHNNISLINQNCSISKNPKKKNKIKINLKKKEKTTPVIFPKSNVNDNKKLKNISSISTLNKINNIGLKLDVITNEFIKYTKNIFEVQQQNMYLKNKLCLLENKKKLESSLINKIFSTLQYKDSQNNKNNVTNNNILKENKNIQNIIKANYVKKNN